MRAGRRRVGRSLAVAGGLAIVATAAAYGYLRSEPGRAWLLSRLLVALDPSAGRIEAAALDTDLFGFVELRDVHVRDDAGRDLLTAERVRADVWLGGLPGRLLVVPRVAIDGLSADLAIGPDGLDLARVWGPPGPDDGRPYTGIGFHLRVDAVDVTATRVRLRAGDVRYGLDDAELVGGVALRGSAVDVRDLALVAGDLRVAPNGPDAPADARGSLGPVRLVGGLHWDPSALRTEALAIGLGPQRLAIAGSVEGLDGDAPTLGLRLTDLHIETDALPWAAWERAEPPITGTFDADGTITGLTNAPHLALAIRTPGGPVAIEGSIATSDPLGWEARVDAGGVDLETFLPGVPRTRLRGSVEARGTGTDWPDGIDATGTVNLRADGAGTGGSVVARGGIALRSGVLRGTELDLRVPGAELRGDVRLTLAESRGAVEVRALRVRLADLATYGVDGLAGDVRFTGAIEGGWGETGDGAFASAEGAIEGDAMGASGASVQRVTGPVAVRWSPAAASFEGTLDVAGVARGEASLESVRASLRVDTDAAAGTGRVAGSAMARALSTGGTDAGALAAPRVGEARLGFDVGWSDAGAAGSVDAELARVEAGALSAPAGQATVLFAGSTVGVTAALLDRGQEVLAVDASADLRARIAQVRRLSLAPAGSPAWSTDGPQRARWTDDGVADLHVSLHGADGGALTVDGAASASGPLALRGHADALPLASLRFLAPDALEGVSGTVTLDAALEGTADAPRLRADAAARGLVVPAILDAGDATLSVAPADGDVVAVRATFANAGEPLAELVGTLPLSLSDGRLRRDAPLDLTAILAPATGAAWNAALAGDPLPLGAASAALTLSGTPAAPVLALTADAQLPAGARGERLELELDAQSDGDAVTLDTVLRERKQRRAQVTGRFDVALHEAAAALLDGRPLPGGDPRALVRGMELDVVPLQLTLPTIAELLDLKTQLDGSLVGGLHVTGTPRQPRAEGALLVVGGRVGGVDVSPAQLVLSSGDIGYIVDANLGFPAPNPDDPAGSLTVRGVVPFDPRLDDPLAAPGLALALEGRDVPFGAVGALLPGVQEPHGLLALDGRVRGTVRAPQPDVRLSLRSAAASLPGLGVRYEDATLDAALDADSLVIRDLSARTVPTDPAVRAASGLGGADGTVVGSVRVALADWTPSRVDGRLQFDRAWLSGLPDLQLRVRSADLTLAGDLPALRLSGDAALETARIAVDESFFTGAGNALALDPAVRVLRGPASDLAGPDATRLGRAQRDTGDDTTLPRWLDLDLGVDLDRSAFLDASMPMRAYLGAVASGFASIQLVAQMDGDLRAEGRDGDLSLEGAVVPVRGTATVFGKPFDIAGGTVAFTGRDYANPILDLTAVHDAGAYGEIEVRIRGSASAPELSFSSDAYPSTDDVLAILVLGRPLAEAQSNDALALVSGLLQSQLSQAGAAAPLDLLELGLSGVRVGQRLGPDLFLAVELNVVADDVTDDRVAVTLQWQLTDAWSAELRAGSTGSITSAVRWRRRFGGPGERASAPMEPEAPKGGR